MKNPTKKPSLSLRAHSIRNLTAAELRGAHGGVNDTGSTNCGCHGSGTKG